MPAMRTGSIASYVLARLAQAVPILFIIIVVNFVLIRLAPGDPMAYIIGDAPVPEEQIAELRRKLGLDAPIHRQLVIYLRLRAPRPSSTRSASPFPAWWPART